MPYQLKDLYSTRHEGTLEVFKSKEFPTEGEWKAVVDNARLLVVSEGFNVDKYAVCETLRAKVSAAAKIDVRPAAIMLAAAGATDLPAAAGKPISDNVSKRVAALETLRHLWLLKKSGSHKLWILSLPQAYRDWPEADLAAKDFDGLGSRIADTNSRFNAEDRKHLSEATKEGLKWVHKAMLVASSPDTKSSAALLRRWFADTSTTDADISKIAATLNDGLKKIAGRIRSTFLLFVDMPMNRGDAAKKNVTAFVFSGEKLDVVYVEAAFFTDRDMFKDLKNWTRIVVHELSHREARTKDHRYRHHVSGLKPDAFDAKFTASHALDNADSWAMFCMDCAGQMSDSDYVKVKVS